MRTSHLSFEKLLEGISGNLFQELPPSFKEVDIYFQPLVDLEKNEIFGYEALARPLSGEPILVLIQRAIQENFLGLFDLYLRLKAIYRAYELEIFPEKYLFLNVIPNCLLKKRPSGITLNLLKALNLPRERIVLEIGESYLPEDYGKFYETLHYFKKQGFKIAVDDFGVGCISYKVLWEFPPDYVKIDRFFVQQNQNPFFEKVIYHFIELAKDLKIELIVEGVEREEEVLFFLDLGINLMQGFFFGKPLLIPHREEKKLRGFKSSYEVHLINPLWAF